jgi:hypothetical protein
VVGVGQVSVSLAEGGDDGRDHPMLAFGALGRQRAGLVDQVESQEGRRALAVGRKLGDGEVAVAPLDRLDPLPGMSGQVLGVEEAPEALDMPGHRCRHLPAVERRPPAGRHEPQGPGQLRLGEPNAGDRPAVDLVPRAPPAVDRLSGPDPP